MLRIFRPLNLLIIALTQYALQYLVLIPSLSIAGLQPQLGFFQFSLLVATTVLIAAGGYVINDILDYQADLINKPDKIFIGKYFSKRNAFYIYFSTIFIGAFIAFYLADFVKKRWLFLIFPSAVLLLFYYSKYFKKIPLLGNLVVSLFCAGVAGIVLFSERQMFAKLLNTQPVLAHKITILFSGYIVFAFFTTFLREIIKDMEDIEGDKKMGLNTLPIFAGINKAKKLSTLIALLILASLFVTDYWLLLNYEWVALIFSVFFLTTPSFLIIHYLNKSEIKSHFSTLSRLVKLVMLSGLVLLILIWKF